MNAMTEFRDPRAVDAWDRSFRLREQDQLRDLTIDATWERVASALTVNDPSGITWSARYLAAFANWQLLPDERVLQWAGTGRSIETTDAPAAVLNLVPFVGCDASMLSIDGAALRNVAALAVRLLDDAAGLFVTRAQTLRIGMIGAADALLRLGLRYDSDAGRTQMSRVAAALAEGCLQGSVSLAAERGARVVVDAAQLRCWQERGTDPGLIAAAQRLGLRYVRLTAIDPHPLLASLANGVSDALDPVSGNARGISSPPSAADSRSGHSDHVDYLAARAAMRNAIQPWIDVEIAA